MQALKKLFLIFVTVSFIACETEVNPPDIEDAEDLLVVNSVISPALEEILVQVSISQKSFGVINNSNDLIDDAVVTISNGTDEEVLNYDDEFGAYRLSTSVFPIVEGGSYRLDVVAGSRQVFGETTVPVGTVNVDSYGFDRNELEVVWQDIEGQENFYRLAAQGYVSEFEFWDLFFFDEDEFVSDINKDGKLLDAKAEVFSFGQRYDSLIVRVMTCTELYYDYYDILDEFVNDDPFADPVRLPSNINGGLGIFTSVNVTEIREAL